MKTSLGTRQICVAVAATSGMLVSLLLGAMSMSTWFVILFRASVSAVLIGMSTLGLFLLLERLEQALNTSGQWSDTVLDSSSWDKGSHFDTTTSQDNLSMKDIYQAPPNAPAEEDASTFQPTHFAQESPHVTTIQEPPFEEPSTTISSAKGNLEADPTILAKAIQTIMTKE